MKQSEPAQYGFAVLFTVLAVLGVMPANAVSEEIGPAGWYLSVGVGANRAATLEQAGHNRDTTCYPTRDCGPLAGGTPAGYRWFYDLRPQTGAAFELSVGRSFSSVRLEFAISRQTLDLEQEFTRSTYLDGSAILPAVDSGYTSNSTSSVDGLTLETLSLNAYYDLPLPQTRVTPYVGLGLGVSLAELSGLHYSIEYECADPSHCKNPERYNGRQDVDMSDTVASVRVHAGADYPLSEGLLLGVKLSYSLTEDMRQRHGYTYHAVPGLTNETRISGIGYATLLINLKYRFGDSPVQAP